MTLINDDAFKELRRVLGIVHDFFAFFGIRRHIFRERRFFSRFVKLLGNDGDEGEICVSGDMGRGYVGLPEQTAQTFTPNPFREKDGHDILIHTGDLGKRLPDGNIIYINRRDWMIKINGQRVEPGEIEAEIRRTSGIKDAVVRDFIDSAGQTFLAAYYTAESEIVEDIIRFALSEKLPGYMIPAYFTRLEKFPVNANGKLDRGALPKPDIDRRRAEYIPPENERQRHICEAFAEKFAAETIKRMAQVYTRIVAGLCEGGKLKDIRLVSDGDIAEMETFNATEADYPVTDIVSMFRAQAAKTPDRTAVIFKDETLTYAQVDDISERIAGKIRSLGIGKGDVVSVLIPRCTYMTTASLGVLKSGAAYQPLDPSYPSERLTFMMSDASAKLLIADEELLSRVPEYKGEVLLTKDIPALPDCGRIKDHPDPSDLFILLYTSGSTGTPKGVMLEHRNIANFCAWYREFCHLDETSRVAAYASYGFDADMMDQYPALTTGACVYIIEEEIRLDLLALEARINEWGITHAFMTTQVGRHFYTMTNTEKLKYLSTGGEKLVPLPPRSGDPAFCNLYGPTECTILATIKIVERLYERVPIGRPLKNYKCYVIDENGRLLPPLIPGEPLIAGRGVGRRYLNRPDLTEKVFIRNPFDSGDDYARAYRSGDIVRLLPNGEIDFIGRNDGQVKVRGFRIELTEVESVIREFPGIRDATVQAFEDEASGEKFIAAYVVADTLYNIPLLLEISDDIDTVKLKTAIVAAVNAHPILKTRLFINDDGDVRMRRMDGDFSFDESSITEREISSIEEERAKLVKPFKLLGGRLFRVEILHGGKTWLFIEMHHIISDGSSIGIFLNDVSAAYEGIQLETESYSGYEVVLNEEKLRMSDAYEKAKNYYKKLVDGAETQSLPTGDITGEHSAVTCMYEMYASGIDAAETKAWCENNKASMNGLFSAAFGLTLNKYLGTESAVFAGIYSGRNDSRLAGTVAMLVKTLPIVVSIDAGKTTAQLAREVSNQLVDSHGSDIYSFAEICRSLNVNADVMFAWQGDEFAFDTLCGKPAKIEPLRLSEAKAPMNLNVFIDGGKIRFSMEYRGDRYSEGYIRGFLSAVECALIGMVRGKWLAEVSVLSEEAREMLDGFNDTAADGVFPTAPDLFAKAAEASPDEIAVIARSGQVKVTYRELWCKSKSIANALIESGVRTNDRVALYMERDEDIYAAYLIYTSGSTGNPKGVEIKHSNLANLLAYNENNTLAKAYVDNSTIFLALAAITFDVSVIEEMMPLYHGKAVSIATDEEIHNPLLLMRTVTNTGVDMMKCTPSYLQSILDVPEAADALGRLKALIVGAEPFPAALYAKIRKAGFTGTLFNSYGPTETCVSVSIGVLDSGQVTVGGPTLNTYFLIRDSFGNILPPYARVYDSRCFRQRDTRRNVHDEGKSNFA